MKKIYKTYQALLGTDKLVKSYCRDHVQITNQSASDLILTRLLDDKPLMVTRLGSTELSCIINHLFIKKSLFGNIVNLAKGMPYFLKFNPAVMNNMTAISGFFPSTKANLTRFSEMYIKDMSDIDILASWQRHESFIYKFLPQNHSRIFLDDLDSFRHENPWTIGLKGKKVLVIHPFQDSIEQQYKKRAYLFKDKRVLPEFDLITIKAIVTFGGANGLNYSDWFEVLNTMLKQIDETDFDVALIGAGAYGLPMAAAVKRKGKKAIHIGGSLQCLFGIKGSRWEAPIYDYNNKYYNEYWVRPLKSETPEGASQLEGACFW